MEFITDISSERPLPYWKKPFSRSSTCSGLRDLPDTNHTNSVALFLDTFNNYFEPENLGAARQVLLAAGFEVHIANNNKNRPLCCGRTFLASGLIDKAKEEASGRKQRLKTLRKEPSPGRRRHRGERFWARRAMGKGGKGAHHHHHRSRSSYSRGRNRGGFFFHHRGPSHSHVTYRGHRSYHRFQVRAAVTTDAGATRPPQVALYATGGVRQSGVTGVAAAGTAASSASSSASAHASSFVLAAGGFFGLMEPALWLLSVASVVTVVQRFEGARRGLSQEGPEKATEGESGEWAHEK